MLSYYLYWSKQNSQPICYCDKTYGKSAEGYNLYGFSPRTSGEIFRKFDITVINLIDPINLELSELRLSVVIPKCFMICIRAFNVDAGNILGLHNELGINRTPPCKLG